LSKIIVLFDELISSVKFSQSLSVPDITKVWHCSPTYFSSHFHFSGSLAMVPNSSCERGSSIFCMWGIFLQHLAIVPNSRHEILQPQDRLLRCSGRFSAI